MKTIKILGKNREEIEKKEFEVSIGVLEQY